MSNPIHWNLKGLFAGDDDPKIAAAHRRAERATARLVRKWGRRRDWLAEPKVLAELLGDYETWLDGEAGHAAEWYYFYSRSNLNQGDDQIRARLTLADQAGTALYNQIRFITHELSHLAPTAQKRLLRAPVLKPYRSFLKVQFERGRHLLSLDTENILAQKQQPAHDEWVSLTERLLSEQTASLTDDDGVTKERPFSEASGLLGSRDRAVRLAAATFIDATAEKCAAVATAELNAILLNKQIDDEARGYERPDSSRLLSDQVTPKMIDTLIEAVAARNDIPQDFYKFKAKYLGVKRLAYHDRVFNPVPMPDVRYDYERSVRLVRGMLARLDGEFATIFSEMVEDGRVDVHPQKGKRGGAYCSYSLRAHPILMLLNHTDTVRDARVLAHETGHAINFTLMTRQSPIYFGVSMGVAETASTFFEDFVTAEILRQTDSPEMRRYLLFEKVSDEISTVFRQIAIYRFEQELHAKFRAQGRVCEAEIGDLFKRHMSSYIGAAVQQPDAAQNWWVHWPHIRSFFYVYSYASGLLLSKILQRRVKDDPSYIKQVKWLLSLGESLTPAEAMSKLGIDLESAATWQIGLDEMAADLKDLRSFNQPTR